MAIASMGGAFMLTATSSSASSLILRNWEVYHDFNMTARQDLQQALIIGQMISPPMDSRTPKEKPNKHCSSRLQTS
jgi:hypothetical protein